MNLFVNKVCDPNALTSSTNFDVVKCYPNAKRGHMKSGGNFPYISRSGEVNLFIKVIIIIITLYFNMRFAGTVG